MCCCSSRLASDAEVLVMPSPARLEQMMTAPSGDLEQQLNAAVSRNSLDSAPFGMQPRAADRPSQLPPTIEEHVHMTARTGSMGYMVRGATLAVGLANSNKLTAIGMAAAPWTSRQVLGKGCLQPRPHGMCARLQQPAEQRQNTSRGIVSP